MISTEVKKEITLEISNNNSHDSNASNEKPTERGQERLRTWLMAIGLFVTALALFANAYGIMALHEWNRRNFAAEMIRDWNEQSNIHKAGIENALPQLFTD